jgi:hypothetical protein
MKVRVLIDVDEYVRRVRVLVGLPNGETVMVAKDAVTSRYFL